MKKLYFDVPSIERKNNAIEYINEYYNTNLILMVQVV